MINIAIVDDNPEFIVAIDRLLGQSIKLAEYETYKYTDEMIFINDIKEGARYDIVFLDIMLNQSNGIDVGKVILDHWEKTKIIFISANSEYFKDVYNVDHTCFLTKPIEPIRFLKALKKAIDTLHNNFINLPLKSGCRRVELDDLLYLENSLKTTVFYFEDGRREDFPIRLTDIEGSLPRNGFIRTHKSYIINIEKHMSAERLQIQMQNGAVIPVSKKYINDVRDKVSLYLGGVL